MNRSAVILLLSLVTGLGGCSTTNSSPQDAQIHTEKQQELSNYQANINSFVGDPSKPPVKPRYPDPSINLQERTGYSLTNGKVYSIDWISSGGEKKPGEAVQIILGKNKEVVTVRGRLSRLDENYKPTEVLVEKITHLPVDSPNQPVIEAQLPKEGDALYLLSAEILGKDGKTAENVFILETAYVPPQNQLTNAKISLDKSTYSKTEKLSPSIYNAGPTRITFGSGYGLETLINGRWYSVPDERLVTSDRPGCNPGETYSNRGYILPDNTKPGHYRIIKHIEADSTGFKGVLAAEFDVTE